MARKNDELIKRTQKVGEGGFGVVYLGSYGEHHEVGIKDIQGRISDEALAEAAILKKLTHRNIIRYIDIVSTRNQTSLIMEFIEGGSLYDYIERTAQSSSYWKATRQMMVDVAHGMSYLHGAHIVHADLKSLNILLRHNYEAVICDFGLARAIGDARTVITENAVGTLAWFAPELCLDRPERSSYASDVWAFGCILLEIITRKIPWADHYQNSLVFLRALAEPKNATIFEDICLSQRAPEKLRAILCRCCSWTKAGRPDFPTIVRDLSTISDVDLHNINEGIRKPVTSKPSKAKPTTSTSRSETKAASASTPSPSKVGCHDTDTVENMVGQLSLGHPKPKRKPSAKCQAANTDDRSSNADTVRYDPVHNRDLYKGPRGGWYYLGPTGNKIYTKNDST